MFREQILRPFRLFIGIRPLRLVLYVTFVLKVFIPSISSLYTETCTELVISEAHLASVVT